MANETRYDTCSYCGKKTIVANKGSYNGLCHKCIVLKDTGDMVLRTMRVDNKNGGSDGSR